MTISKAHSAEFWAQMQHFHSIVLQHNIGTKSKHKKRVGTIIACPEGSIIYYKMQLGTDVQYIVIAVFTLLILLLSNSNGTKN